MKNIAYWVLEALCICLCLCLGVFVFGFCIFVSLRLGQCHHQMISFQKIYGLYSLKHHAVEINGNVTLEDTQTYRHVNIELEFCEMLTEFAIKLVTCMLLNFGCYLNQNSGALFQKQGGWTGHLDTWTGWCLDQVY